MAARKSERILNLTICLLATPRFLTREQIRDLVDGYDSDDQRAFERMFERDKEELRGLGVPIETGTIGFDDEIGYRIPRGDFELPPVDFTPDEAAAMAVAAQVWDRASLAGSTSSAIAKLRAAGVEPDGARLRMLTPQLDAREEAFEPLWRAVVTRTPVAFGYREARRRLEPWGITSHRGAWYVIGHDIDRDDRRMFKLARITDIPGPIGGAGSFDVPTGLDMHELARSLDPLPADSGAVVAVRGEKAPALRRGALPTSTTVLLPDGFAAWEVAYADPEAFVADVAAYGADVIVCEPADLRMRVRAHLGGVA